MISVEGDFARTGWYGLRRIRHKARKYRRFGGVRIILGWHACGETDKAQKTAQTQATPENRVLSRFPSAA